MAKYVASNLSLSVYENNSASGTLDLDFSKYNIFEITSAGNLTLNASGLISTARSVGTIFVDVLGMDSVSLSNIQTQSGFKGLSGAYSVSSASYDNVSFDVSGQDTEPTGLEFSPDGFKLFVSGSSSRKVYQYTLTTGFDLTTASYNNVSLDVSGQLNTPNDLTFNNEGTEMFLISGTGTIIYQYTLTTGFDLTTASYNNVSLDVSGQTTTPTDVKFNQNGTKLFITSSDDKSVYQYTLTTGFDLTTALYDASFTIDLGITGMDFNDGGTKMFLSLGATDKIRQYTLTNPFDITTSIDDNVSLSVSQQDTVLSGIELSSDGAKIFAIGRETDSIYQYTSGSTVRLDCCQRGSEMLAVGSYF